MLPRIAYLDFAGRWFGQVPYDLASSGLAAIGAAELGGSVAEDDFGARARFQNAVALRYGVPAADVVPCLGGSGAVFAVMATVLEPGERVLVETPGYEPLIRVPEGLGHPVDRFERSHEQAYALDPERVLRALKVDTRLVVITNPHNPTGAVASDAALSELAGCLAQLGVLLFVDEAYLELAAPKATARKLGENVITCSSATKCWGMHWARAGFAIVPERFAADVSHVERHVAGLAPPSAWAWGERALERADALLARARELQAGKRALVDAFLSRHAAELDWVAPHESSLFGWVHDRRGVCSLTRIERAAAELGVLVSPGEFFGVPGAFRLSWTAPAPIVEAGLERLAAAFELVTLPAP